MRELHARANETGERAIDLQDALLLIGSIALVGGVGWIYRPAGAILFGLLCIGYALLIEWERGKVARIEAFKDKTGGTGQ